MKKVIRLNENDVERLVKKIINEDKGKTLKKACWKGYEAIGMKTKNGKEVPNCVPIKEDYMEDYMEEGSSRYMFFSNLQQMKRQCEYLLDFDESQIEKILENGHDWAQDHIAEAKNNMDQVFDFIMNEIKGEDTTEPQKETYLPNLRGKKIYEDQYGSVELLPLQEAEYKGRKVTLGKPFYTPDGPKKSSVYVKNAKGNVVKVNFGDPNMEIKKDNPERRKSFRARHRCDNPGPKWKARYWSCKAW